MVQTPTQSAAPTRLAARKCGQGMPVVPATMPFSWRSTTTKRATTTMSGPQRAVIASARAMAASVTPKRAVARDRVAAELAADQVADVVAERPRRAKAASDDGADVELAARRRRPSDDQRAFAGQRRAERLERDGEEERGDAVRASSASKVWTSPVTPGPSRRCPGGLRAAAIVPNTPRSRARGTPMTSLTGPSRPAASGNADSLVVFLHGYGADGDDLIGLADPLAPHLPNTRFLAPNAPQRCANNPMGYQWFPIPWLDGTPEAVARAQAACGLRGCSTAGSTRWRWRHRRSGRCWSASARAR